MEKYVHTRNKSDIITREGVGSVRRGVLPITAVIAKRVNAGNTQQNHPCRAACVFRLNAGDEEV